MFFIRLFLANTWGKNRGWPCLFLHKLLWKVDMALRSQSEWIICSAGTGARYKIKPIVFEVCTRDQARFRLFFLCLISAIQKFKLEKNTLNTKEQGKSRFDEILEVWIFILDYFVAPAFCLIPVRYGLIFLLLHNNAWQRNLKKRLLIPILYMLACLVSIHSKMWIQ